MYQKSLQRRLFALSAALVMGCSSQVGPSNGAADQTVGALETESVDEVGQLEGLPHRNPVMGLLKRSLAEVNLTGDQQNAIQMIRADLEVATKPTRDARRTLAFAAADGVSAGVLDDARLNAELARLVQAVESAKPAFQDALNRLHATLDASQRKQLIAKMREKGMALRERVNEGGVGRAFVGARLAHFADELKLSTEQRVSIRERVRSEFQDPGIVWGPDKRAEAQARMRQLGEAFRSESFDARNLEIGRQAGQATQKVATGMVRFAKIVLPALTPDQRVRFAAMIRQHAEASGAGVDD